MPEFMTTSAPAPSTVFNPSNVPRLRKSYPELVEVETNTVLKNGDTTFKLPTGKLYHFLVFKVTGMTLSQFGRSQMWLNKKMRSDIVSGADLDLINQYDGFTAYGNGNSGYLIWSFMRPRLASLQQQFETSLNTGEPGRFKDPKSGKVVKTKGIEDFWIRFNLSGIAGGEEIRVFAYQSDSIASDRGAGNIRQILATPVDFFGAGVDIPVHDQPEKSAQYAMLNRLMLIPSVPNSIDEFKLRLDGSDVRNVDAVLNDYLQNNIVPNIHVPQTGLLYAVDSTMFGQGNVPWQIYGNNQQYFPLVTPNQATAGTLYSDLNGLL